MKIGIVGARSIVAARARWRSSQPCERMPNNLATGWDRGVLGGSRSVWTSATAHRCTHELDPADF
jgi:hypothetical protein